MDLGPFRKSNRPSGRGVLDLGLSSGVTKCISVITKANSQDTTLAHRYILGDIRIYTVYTHTVLTTHNTTRQRAKESSPF